MTEVFSGRNGLYALLLVLLVMVVSVGFKYVRMTSVTPGKVKGELEEVFSRVSAVRPMSLRKAQFLMEWGNYRNSDQCSGAVSASRDCSGNGFEGDIYVVTYKDSIEFPGFLPTISRQFRVTREMNE
ncbi:MAG: hypothetical protein AVO35_10145 [Candidatus Aegiribacteria sp. MLS_C]|nr:MAG: hypothetical protein AVO35_10145 [Candidatus Aegiribacteria sp. MLS_C]